MFKFQVKVGQARNKETGEMFPIYKTIDNNGKPVKVIFPSKTVPNAPATNCTVYAEKDDVRMVKRGNYRDLYINKIHHTEAIFQENLFAEQETKTYLPVEDCFTEE